MKTFAVIGDPINHSLSPAVHNAAFKSLGMDCAYMAYRVPREELAEGVASLRESGVAGFNVTIPHKISITDHLDSVAESCSVVGAANTIHNESGSLRGHNTDMEGFMRPLRNSGARIRGGRALLLGAGGAARAAAAGLVREGIGSILVCNRDRERARGLAEYCGGLGATVDHGPLPSFVAGGFDMVVNATSAGMGGVPFPVDMSGVDPDTIIYDMVYRPIRTDFVAQAKAAGAKHVIYGWEMLLAQAALSFEIWHGVEAPVDVMRRTLLGGFA